MKGKKLSLDGMIFGKLSVVRATKERIRKNIVWLCKCECGKEVFVQAVKLKNGGVQSCGCTQKKDLLGQRFGRLTVKKLSNIRTPDRGYVWTCECDCGTIIERTSRGLVRGTTTSCGCLKKEKSSFRLSSLNANRGLMINGWRFGRLVAQKIYKKSDAGFIWTCECDCGGNCNVPASRLMRGTTNSCGCLAKEKSRERALSDNGTIHLARMSLCSGSPLDYKDVPCNVAEVQAMRIKINREIKRFCL